MGQYSEDRRLNFVRSPFLVSQSHEQGFKVLLFLLQVSKGARAEIIHPFKLKLARKCEPWGYRCTKPQVWSRVTSFSELFSLSPVLHQDPLLLH